MSTPGAADAPQQAAGTAAGPAVRRLRPWHVVGAGAIIATAAVAAWFMTGPAPAPAGTGASENAPPLVLTAEQREMNQLRQASDELSAGRLDAAARRFTALVADRPDDVTAQIGLILTRWRSLGPVAVQRDLEQLQREYPHEPTVGLHLGIAQVLAGERELSAGTLAAARTAARLDAAHAEVATRADDLLHPQMAPGHPPVLIRPSDLDGQAARAVLARLQAALTRQHWPAVLRQAAAADRAARSAAARDAQLLRIAAATARFEKDRPSRALGAITELGGGQATSAAELHRGLVLLWTGRRREGADVIRTLARSGAGSDRWRAQAAALAHRLG